MLTKKDNKRLTGKCQTVFYKQSSDLGDIYESVFLEDTLWKSKVTSSDIPMDFGSGYYQNDLTQGALILRLLMYGEHDENKADIPRGTVWGFNKYSVLTNVNCGGIVNLQDRSFRNDDSQN